MHKKEEMDDRHRERKQMIMITNKTKILEIHKII